MKAKSSLGMWSEGDLLCYTQKACFPSDDQWLCHQMNTFFNNKNCLARYKNTVRWSPSDTLLKEAVASICIGLFGADLIKHILIP